MTVKGLIPTNLTLDACVRPCHLCITQTSTTTSQTRPCNKVKFYLQLWGGSIWERACSIISCCLGLSSHNWSCEYIYKNKNMYIFNYFAGTKNWTIWTSELLTKCLRVLGVNSKNSFQNVVLLFTPKLQSSQQWSRAIFSLQSMRTHW